MPTSASVRPEPSNPPCAPATATILAPGEGTVLDVVGDKVRVLADGRTTSGRLFIFEETCGPGGGPPLHRHGIDDEFFYVIEGRFRFVLDGREAEAGPGSFIAAPRGSLHTFGNIGDTPGRLLIITSPAGLEEPFRVTHEASRLPGTPPPGPEALAAIFRNFDITFHGPPIAAR